MSNKIGIIKSISQGSSVIATAKDGTQRVLKVGDEIFLGETIQTTDIDSKVVITANDGKDITLIGKDTLNLDKKESCPEVFCVAGNSRRISYDIKKNDSLHKETAACL